MLPSKDNFSILHFGFLRASGGVSLIVPVRGIPAKFSPRERRCFYLGSGYGATIDVFSARAEVFL